MRQRSTTTSPIGYVIHFSREKVWLHPATIAIGVMVALLAYCSPARLNPRMAPNEGTVQDEQAADALPSTTPKSIPTQTPTPFPDPLVLGLESRWVAAGEAAVADLNLPLRLIVQPVEPSPALLQDGIVDFILLPDSQGIPVTERAMALAVPWTSEWEALTIEEAQVILEHGSAFVAQLEWPEMTPDLKPLKVSGLHPSQPGYPLKSAWSLLARPGLEGVAEQLAAAMSLQMDDRVAKLTAVGDIVLARGLGDRIQSGEDRHPFAAVEHLLTDADLTIGNLESALGEGGRAEEKGYTFLAPPAAAGVLGEAGFDVLSLANNHAMDYGSEVLLGAIRLLADEGIQTVGAGADITQATAPRYLELDNGSYAILGFVDVPVEVRGFDTRTWAARESTPGVAWADSETMRAAITEASKAADFVVVLLHSGYEYVSPPSPPQLNAGRLAIDAGADLVIGHHSHILQGVEFYGEGIILYGLGNFAFEDSGVLETGLMNIWIDSDGIRTLEFVPLILGQDGRPVSPDKTQADSIRKSLYQLSRITTP